MLYPVIRILFSAPLFCLLGNTSLLAQDTLTIRLPHGELRISKSCSEKASSGITSSSMCATGKLVVSEVLLREAEEKNILSDRVYVQLDYDQTCKLTGYRIIPGGKLTGFNELVTLFCDELMASGSGSGSCPFSCMKEAGSVTVPFSFKLQ